MQLIHLSFIMETIAFACSVPAFFSRNYPVGLKILTPYLLMTLAVEVLAFCMTTFWHFESNHSVYNVYTILSTLTYLRLLQVMINDKRISKIILFAIATFILLAVANILFIQHIDHFNTYTYIVGGFLIAGFCGVFFSAWLSKKGIVKVWNDPAFWLAAGLPIYFLPKIIFYASLTYMAQVGRQEDSQALNKSFHSTNEFLICVLYIFISINFLCSLRKPI